MPSRVSLGDQGDTVLEREGMQEPRQDTVYLEKRGHLGTRWGTLLALWGHPDGRYRKKGGSGLPFYVDWVA